jgi:hypothetical protein
MSMMLLVRDPADQKSGGGFGETPKPTVKVWMGEGTAVFHD